MPPAGPTYPLEHAQLKSETRHGASVILVWFLHDGGRNLPVRETDGVADVGQLPPRLEAQIVISSQPFYRAGHCGS
jgi:hypothetical protein